MSEEKNEQKRPTSEGQAFSCSAEPIDRGERYGHGEKYAHGEHYAHGEGYAHGEHYAHHEGYGHGEKYAHGEHYAHHGEHYAHGDDCECGCQGERYGDRSVRSAAGAAETPSSEAESDEVQ